MVLGEGDRVGVGAGGVEPAVDVAGKSADRRPLLGPGKTLEPLMVERGEGPGDVHQPGQPIRPELGGGTRDPARIGSEAWPGRCVGVRRLEVEGLGGGQEDQHRVGASVAAAPKSKGEAVQMAFRGGKPIRFHQAPPHDKGGLWRRPRPCENGAALFDRRF